jgi:hypothetical protein
MMKKSTVVLLLLLVLSLCCVAEEVGDTKNPGQVNFNLRGGWLFSQFQVCGIQC